MSSVLRTKTKKVAARGHPLKEANWEGKIREDARRADEPCPDRVVHELKDFGGFESFEFYGLFGDNVSCISLTKAKVVPEEIKKPFEHRDLIEGGAMNASILVQGI